jgi:hypothetical protein
VPLRANERYICGRKSYDFGDRLRFDAANVTKIKISPGTPNYTLQVDLTFNAYCQQLAYRCTLLMLYLEKQVCVDF